jgi:hypothetical protein
MVWDFYLLKKAARECINVAGEAFPTGDLPTPDKIGDWSDVREQVGRNATKWLNLHLSKNWAAAHAVTARDFSRSA